jgi:hypothetical protein
MLVPSVVRFGLMNDPIVVVPDVPPPIRTFLSTPSHPGAKGCRGRARVPLSRAAATRAKVHTLAAPFARFASLSKAKPTALSAEGPARAAALRWSVLVAQALRLHVNRL